MRPGGKKRSARFALLADLQRRRELLAAAELARLEAETVRQGALLSQVEEFDAQYRSSLRRALDGGVNGQRLAELHRMQGQVTQAASQQARRSAAAGEAQRQGEAAWRTARARRRVLERLEERFVQNERRREAHREQAESDDRARPGGNASA